MKQQTLYDYVMQAMAFPTISFLLIATYAPVSTFAYPAPENTQSLNSPLSGHLHSSASVKLGARDMYPGIENDGYAREKSSEWDRRLLNTNDDDSAVSSSSSASSIVPHHPQSKMEAHTTYHQYNRPQSAEGYSHDNPQPQGDGSHTVHKYFKTPTYPGFYKRDLDLGGQPPDEEPAGDPSKRSRRSPRFIGAHANTESHPASRVQTRPRSPQRSLEEQDMDKKYVEETGDDSVLTADERRIFEGEDPGERRLEQRRPVGP